MAHDYRCLSVNPEDPGGEPVELIIPASVYQRAYKEDRVHYENLRAAKYVLDNVQRVFSDVREYNQGGWCFTARPLEWHLREQVVGPFPEHLVYAVYIHPRHFVYEWRAEKVDNEDNLCPVDWRRRYKALLWKRTS